jgi:hypothetical protein
VGYKKMNVIRIEKEWEKTLNSIVEITDLDLDVVIVDIQPEKI